MALQAETPLFNTRITLLIIWAALERHLIDSRDFLDNYDDGGFDSAEHGWQQIYNE